MQTTVQLGPLRAIGHAVDDHVAVVSLVGHARAHDAVERHGGGRGHQRLDTRRSQDQLRVLFVKQHD